MGAGILDACVPLFTKRFECQRKLTTMGTLEELQQLLSDLRTQSEPVWC